MQTDGGNFIHPCEKLQAKGILTTGTEMIIFSNKNSLIISASVVAQY